MIVGPPELRPTARSYDPVPGRMTDHPSASASLPTVIRTEPSVRSSIANRFSTITNAETREIPAARYVGRGTPGAAGGSSTGRNLGSSSPPAATNQNPGAGGVQWERIDRGSSISNRKPIDTTGAPGGGGSQVIQNTSPVNRDQNGRQSGRDISGGSVSASSKSSDRSSGAGNMGATSSRDRSKDRTGNTVTRPETTAPRRQDYNPPRFERTTPEPRSKPEATRPESKPKPGPRSEASPGFDGGSGGNFIQPQQVESRPAQQNGRWTGPSGFYSPPGSRGSEVIGSNMRWAEPARGGGPGFAVPRPSGVTFPGRPAPPQGSSSGAPAGHGTRNR